MFDIIGVFGVLSRRIFSLLMNREPDAASQQEYQPLLHANPELFETKLFIPLVQR